MDHIMIVFCFVCIFCGYTTARETSIDSVTYRINTDRSVTLTCETHISRGTSDIKHIWILNGKFLTKNTDILTNQPARYKVKHQKNKRYHVYTLTISNPVENDRGIYKCRIDYKLQGSHYSTSKIVDVTITSYLPPLNYPFCSIRPSQTLNNGDLAAFECKVGATTSKITLKLTLQSIDGSITLMDESDGRRYNAEKHVTLQNNMAMFICHMTSETFPTAYRNCSAGPLIVTASTTLPPGTTTTAAPAPTQSYITTNLSPWTTQPEALSTMVTTEMHPNDSTAQSNTTNRASSNQNKSDGQRQKMPLLPLVACASGALILSLLIILGVQCQKGTPTNTSQTIDPINRAYQADSEPEPNDLLSQIEAFHTGTKISPNSAKHQCVHTYEHTIEINLTSSSQVMPTEISTIYNHTLSWDLIIQALN